MIEVVLSLLMDLLDPRPEDYNHMNILKSYLEIWLIPSANPDGLGVVHEGLDAFISCDDFGAYFLSSESILLILMLNLPRLIQILRQVWLN